MLDTLYRFGLQLSQNADRDEFDDIILTDFIKEIDRDKFDPHVGEVIFDLDEQQIKIGRMMPFSELDKRYQFSPYNLRCIRIQGGNNKSIYPTVDPRKSYDPWIKTIFGKNDKNSNQPICGELYEVLQKDYPGLKQSLIFNVLERIFLLKPYFEAQYPDWKSLANDFQFDEKNRGVMLFASVVCTELGIGNPTPIVMLDGYDDLLRRKFIQKDNKNSQGNDIKVSKLCYVTGRNTHDVSEPDSGIRYNLNKMFVTTTKNYANDFNDNEFAKNYQLSGEAQIFLDRGSAHILKNYTVKIAGIDHCLIPQFRGNQEVDLDEITSRIKKKSDLLFQLSKPREDAHEVILDVKHAADGEIYWINFLGYESDGNFFKSINRIEDISKTYFEQISQGLSQVEKEMGSLIGQEWYDVLTIGNEPSSYNFYTIYYLIPLRKDKGKRNEALVLFKAILERRPVLQEKIFSFFSELIQCHRYGRYIGYNINPNSNFDFALRDAVFKYHAFFLFLKKLKLLQMPEVLTSSNATLVEKNATVAAFFERMDYSDDHRAMFFLGRILNSVGSAQFKKGHASKPVLGKVNYNGMDAGALKRLHADLFEKCRQYDILKYNEGNFSKFTDFFHDSENNRWDKRMRPDESLFYLLTGYSFRSPKESDEDQESIL